MAVDIVIADSSGPLNEDFHAGDVARVYDRLLSCRKRSIVFVSEVLTGFIIHTSIQENSSTSPLKAYLSTNYTSNGKVPYGHNSGNANVAGDVTTLNTVGQTVENSTSVILKHRILGTVTSSSSEAVKVTVWMFEYSVASVGHESTKLCLSASLRNDSSLQPTTISTGSYSAVKDAIMSKDNSILLEHSETEILTAPPDVHPLIASIEIPVFAPLLLNVKCTNPGSLIGQEKSFFITFRIQGPRLPLPLKKNLHISISALNVTSKSGELIKMGPVQFPVHLSTDDALNLTYRLRSHDQILELSGSFPVVPISLNATAKYERFNDTTLSYSSVSNDLSINWSPVIDLNSKQQPSSIPQNRRSVVVSSSSNSERALPFSPSDLSSAKFGHSGASATIGGNGAPGTNGSLSAFSSPSLSITKSGSNLKNKISRSVALLPGSALAVTLNISVPPTSILSGLKILFTGKLNFNLGEVVTWKLQVINAGVRNLRLHMTAKRAKRISPLYMQPNNSSSVLGISGIKKGDREAKAVRFEGQLTTYNLLQLYNTYNSLKPARDGIIILTNDLNLGILEAGQVYETEFKLVGFVKGIHTLDGLRIYDVNSGEGIELGRILEVFVV